MALQLHEEVHCLEVLSDNTIQVCICKQVVDTASNNSPVGGPEMHRYYLRPGANLSGQPAKVVAVANAIWN